MNLLLVTLLATCSQPNLPILKRELGQAYKELSIVQERVLRLEETIARQEIEKVRSHFVQVAPKDVELEFVEQRGILAHIIQNHPTCAQEAQAVLDQILTYITNQNEAR